MKKYSILAFLFVLSLTVSACSQKPTGGGGDGTESAQKTSKVGVDDRGIRMPDFGQPEEDADFRGLVTSIVGNEVTILKIERPQPGSRGAVNEGNNEEEVKEGDGARPVGMGTGTGGRMPGMGAGMRGAGDNNEDTKAAMLERIKEMSTGEEKFIIPVGIKMLKPETAETKEPKMIEASLSDIKSNSMVNVWLDKNVTDKKTATFVMVMQ